MWNNGIYRMNPVDDAEAHSKNTPCVLYAEKPCNTSVCSAAQNLKGCYTHVMDMVMPTKQEIL